MSHCVYLLHAPHMDRKHNVFVSSSASCLFFFLSQLIKSEFGAIFSVPSPAKQKTNVQHIRPKINRFHAHFMCALTLLNRIQIFSHMYTIYKYIAVVNGDVFAWMNTPVVYNSIHLMCFFRMCTKMEMRQISKNYTSDYKYELLFANNKKTPFSRIKDFQQHK